MMSQNTNLFANVNAERTKRSSNFSTKEVKYLIQLVDNKKEVIESKKTDRTTSEEKVKAWLEIEEEFNAVFEDYRSFKVLKTKYENLKKNVKRKLPTNVSNLSVLKIIQSGEHAVTNEPLSDFEYDLSEDDNTLHTSNASDVDMKPQPPLNEQELDAAAEEYVFETLLFGEAQTSTSSPLAQKPVPKPPSLSEQPKSQSLTKVEKKKPAIDVWEQVAHKKLKKLDLEMHVIEEEWKLRKRKLELEVENARIENQFKEEKLKLELELLKQKLQNNNNNSS
ncbi:myb/SANT-like DNA-binding domain-containing protein 4 [Lucilia sericata]|uniref:myb/SANT-like DNA-binding domain-containing protein 4 n=1 Tax=Lucilia sericata TaxID=13632 RepID=UPI0018A7FF16|nr:myb/SANT-like DNA-binding domain-containing protein 4 [Lucilia sericata]